MTNGTVVKKNDEWHWQRPSSKCGLALVLLILRLQKEWCCGSYGPNGVCIHWWAVLSPFAGATGSNQCALLPQEGWAWSRGPSPVSAKAPAAAATSPYCFLFGTRPSNFDLSDCRVQSETDHRPLRIQRRLPHQSL